MSARDSIRLANGLPFSPARLIAIPKSMANTIICRTVPFAIASTGLLGTISRRVCTKLGASLASTTALAAKSIPTPGCNKVPIASPIVIATAVVVK